MRALCRDGGELLSSPCAICGCVDIVTQSKIVLLQSMCGGLIMSGEFDVPNGNSLFGDGSRPVGLARRTEAETPDYMGSMIRELRRLAEGIRDERLAALLTLVQFEIDHLGRRYTRRD